MSKQVDPKLVKRKRGGVEDENWYIQFLSANGKRKTKTTGTADLTDATVILNRFISDREEKFDPKDFTISQSLDLWWDKKGQHQSSAKNARGNVQRAKKMIGHMTPADFTYDVMDNLEIQNEHRINASGKTSRLRAAR